MNRLARTALMFLIVGLLALGLLFVQSQAGSSANDLVTQTLNAQGFSNIEVNWTPAGLVCQSGEQGYAFNAVNRDGRPVQGIVCARTSLVARHAYIVYR
jgi:hypothetical protein